MTAMLGFIESAPPLIIFHLLPPTTFRSFCMGTQLPQSAASLLLALQTLHTDTSREQKQQANSFLETFQKSVFLPYFDYYFLCILANAKPSHQD